MQRFLTAVAAGMLAAAAGPRYHAAPHGRNLPDRRGARHPRPHDLEEVGPSLGQDDGCRHQAGRRRQHDRLDTEPARRNHLDDAREHALCDSVGARMDAAGHRRDKREALDVGAGDTDAGGAGPAWLRGDLVVRTVRTAGTPKPIVDRRHAEIVPIFGLPDLQSNMKTLGPDPVLGCPDELVKTLAAEITQWAKRVIRDSGTKAA